jgi:hypothetical protein
MLKAKLFESQKKTKGPKKECKYLLRSPMPLGADP